jgi:AraC-like DNA-binding protein
MPRQTRANLLDNTPRPVVAVGNAHAPGTGQPHVHLRAQLLYASSGVVTVWTEQGSWVAPPGRAVWIPPGVRHAIRMSGPVRVCNLYVLAREAARRGLPSACGVVAVSALLQALIEEAVDLPLLYAEEERDGRVMALILDELVGVVAPAVPLHAPLPADPRLARLCAEMIAHPPGQVTIDALACRLGMSRSTFVRRFRASTGMGFAAWWRQAMLLAALERLAAGASVTEVAMAVGYDSPSAFTAHFRRTLGVPPSRYFSVKEEEPPDRPPARAP